MHADPGHYSVRGTDAAGHVAFDTNAWQFFAFLFGAFFALALTLIDEVPNDFCYAPYWRWVLKIVAFVGFGRLLLFNLRVKRCIIKILPHVSTKERR
jgi:hypothetical protein